MTLPKIFALTSKNFNIFDAVSFEASTTTNSSLSYQSAQNSEQQLLLRSLNSLHTTMSSSLSSIPNTSNADRNETMLEATNANQNIHNTSQLACHNQESQSLLECIMPGIFLTKDFISWKEEQLRAHGFTHIIIIDKHIQELYYPNQQPDIFKLCSLSNEKTDSKNSSSLNAFDCYCSPPSDTDTNHLSYGKEFEVIDLNFGEKSYLTTVLPNCYKAVKFIDKALQAGGTILVIDCNGGEQKCITIIVAYLMYKNNIPFSNAFARLKEFYNKADLDSFYMSQLYEYEPILQVQRAQLRGHSCSRKLHAAILKRKITSDDEHHNALATPYYFNFNSNTSGIDTKGTPTTTDLLNNCNPLNSFDSTQMEREDIKERRDNNNIPKITSFMSEGRSPLTRTGGWYNWDDCAME